MAKLSPWVVLRRRADAAKGGVGACPSGPPAIVLMANPVLPYPLRKVLILLRAPKWRLSLVPILAVVLPLSTRVNMVPI